MASSPDYQASTEDNLSILQWNCRSLFTNVDRLAQLLSEQHFDIIALQSVGTISKTLPILENFHYPPYKRVSDRKYRTVIYVRKGLSTSITPITGLKDGFAVTVDLENSDPITLINVYYPNGIANNEQVEWLKEIKGGRYIIVGDFNAHSTQWNPSIKNSDRGGKLLEEIIDDNVNLCIKNDGSFTRLPQREGEGPTAIDLTLCTISMYFKLTFDTFPDSLGSDHLPIVLTYDEKPKFFGADYEGKFNYSKANWPLFKEFLSNCSFSDDFNDPDKWYKEFQEVVLTAATNSIPKFKIGNKTRHAANEYWNDDCQKAKSAFRKATKRYLRVRCDENELAKDQAELFYSKVRAEAKKNYWLNYLQQKVKTYKDTGILYKKLNKIKGRYDPPERPLEIDGCRIVDPKAKADIFAKTFASVSQNSSLTQEQYAFRSEQEKEYAKPIFKNSSQNNDFTMVELNKALFSIRNAKKSTGADPVSYIMIKQFPIETKEILLTFYNHIWQTGFVPSSWKQAQVSAIPKPGKPTKDPSSYRPISLTPHASKLYERLISNRLDYFIEKNDILPRCQTGFRRNRSCIENLTKLSSHVKKAMMNRRPVMAAFFDVKRAFDTVWHNGLLHKLHQIGISENMYLFFKSFLTERSLRVKVGGALSDAHTLEMGIPQGSIVAPTAFSLMLCDISYIEFNNASISLYADDLALWSTSKYRRTNIERFTKCELKNFQHNVDLISNYMFSNGFTLSPDKSVFIIFSNSCRINKDAAISINGQQVYPSEEVKYLGVTLDRGFTFTSHINNLITKTRKNLNLIKLLKREEGVNNLENLKLLITSLVRSRLRYGEEIFCSASPSQLQRLEQCETSIIKQILNIPNHADPILVYREIGLTPLTLSRQVQTTKTILRLGASENDLCEELDLDFNDKRNPGIYHRLRARPRQLGRAVSVINYIEPIIEEAEIGSLNINYSSANRFFCCPWEEVDLDIKDTLGDIKKSDNPLLLKALAEEVIHEHSDYIRIYTDGSLKDEKAGCAFVAPNLSYSERYKLNDGISIFSAELYALEMALEFASTVKDDKIIIFSDSKSVLQTMKHQSSTRVNHALMLMHEMLKKGKSIKIQWIPSHVNICGNDLADSAAKSAAEDVRLPVTNLNYSITEMNSKIKKAEQSLWAKQFNNKAVTKAWCEPNSMITKPFVSSLECQGIFLRLRCKVTKYEIIQTLCLCSDSILTVSHLFECSHVTNQLQKTKFLCHIHGLALDYLNCLSYHSEIGYQLAYTFISELLDSDIGHLL